MGSIPEIAPAGQLQATALAEGEPLVKMSTPHAVCGLVVRPGEEVVLDF